MRVLALLFAGLAALLAAPATAQTSAVVIGGYGNLAGKYLWQALFDLQREGALDAGATLVGAGTADPEAGRARLDATLAKGVRCAEANGPDCPAALEAFRAGVQYEQLKSDDDYLRLGGRLEAEAAASGREDGRLYYLSVPPSAYPEIARRIALSRPSEASDAAWLRAVVEKPFGHDVRSATELAETMARHLREEEIYRVDHYMGKSLVQGLPPFLGLNAERYSLGRDSVRLAHVAMHEGETCEGRTWFYSPVGVVRDVMQNHLSQLLASAALPPSATADGVADALERAAVMDAVKALSGAAPPQLRQYATYLEHVEADGADEEGVAAAARTATAAAVVLEVDNEQWDEVPWVVTAGKALAEREAFVRLFLHAGDDDCAITFSVQGGDLGTAIDVCEALPAPEAPEGWEAVPGRPHRLVPAETPLNAYRVLLGQALGGDRSNFLGVAELMRAWHAWDPLLEQADAAEPELYALGDAGFNVWSLAAPFAPPSPSPAPESEL